MFFLTTIKEKTHGEGINIYGRKAAGTHYRLEISMIVIALLTPTVGSNITREHIISHLDLAETRGRIRGCFI